MSGIQPFYAVKCNSDPALLKTLASLGAGFDCASKVLIHDVCILVYDSEMLVCIIYL